MYDAVGGKMKETGTIHWKSPNIGATNESGFTALPGGYRAHGHFEFLSNYAYFWSNTYEDDCAWGQELWYDRDEIYTKCYGKVYVFSVRCLKD